MKRQYNKVFVGLSGGVDSAVSAALLKKTGHDVTGVYIKVWQPDWIDCNWKEERREAMRVAAHLGIPFITLDAEKEYKQGVIYYMISEYSLGRTPNPDVMCNREVKFGAFWKWAKKNGADYIATGHYARVVAMGKSAVRKSNDSFSLLAGVDQNKDQSYFLWTLNQKDLNHVLFPVGGLTKPEVRKLAQKFKLPNADKKDSQGLCFIGKIDVKEFLAHYLKRKTGKVLNEAGEVIGTHSGAIFFTLGERHGFTIKNKTPEDLPYYVISKDISKNTITVSNNKLSTKISDDDGKNSGNNLIVKLDRINWIDVLTPANGSRIYVRTRYRQPLMRARIVDPNNGSIEIENITDPVTPGQSLVVYDKNGKCLGGGIIH